VAHYVVPHTRTEIHPRTACHSKDAVAGPERAGDGPGLPVPMFL